MGKAVYLVRHAQSTFNEIFERTSIDPYHFDARLTQEGFGQIESARPQIRALSPDLIVTSPLTRALQTTIGIFENNCPVLVEPLLTEQLSNSCDVGRSPADLAEEFPSLGFSHLSDRWWYDGPKDHRGIPVELLEQLGGRISEFLRWLDTRSEEHIILVGHGTFFFQLSGTSLRNCEHHRWHPPLHP
jgi:glucosyl-3-phosphoglycerate phosphatase